jgi:hypothetical protein
MATIDATAYNELLIDKLSSSDGLTKFAQLESDIIRDKILEVGFARNLLTAKEISRNDPNIQEDVQTDTIYYLARVETFSPAMSVAFRGNANSMVWQGKKFPISFFKIETAHFNTDEMTIRSIPYNFTADIEKKFPLMIQLIEDRTFVKHVELCAQLQQLWANGNIWKKHQKGSAVVEAAVIKGNNVTSTTFDVVHPAPADFARLAALFPGVQGEQLLGTQILISAPDYERFSANDFMTLGSDLLGKVVREGYTENTLLGRKVVKTIKTGVLRPGNIYMFAPKEFGGLFLKFIDTKLYIERYGDRYESWAGEVVGMGFGNMKYVKKLELYGASSAMSGPDQYSADTADTGYEAVIPLSEEDLFKVENVNLEASPTGYVPQIY